MVMTVLNCLQTISTTKTLTQTGSNSSSDHMTRPPEPGADGAPLLLPRDPYDSSPSLRVDTILVLAAGPSVWAIPSDTTTLTEEPGDSFCITFVIASFETVLLRCN